jgi:hypothetical protein
MASRGSAESLCDSASSALVAVAAHERSCSLEPQVHEFDLELNHEFLAEYDEEGVYFYQAYSSSIADWALEHQRFGGPDFNAGSVPAYASQERPKDSALHAIPVYECALSAARMTWIKPSFAWVLYRSGYGSKHNQERVLKIKLPHVAVASLLSACKCAKGGGGSLGRVQWDPARDLMSAEGAEPRRMLRLRAIQIGLRGRLSEAYVAAVTQIQDVTALAHRVQAAHGAGSRRDSGCVSSLGSAERGCAVAAAMAALADDLPRERPYMPHCEADVLRELMLIR